MARWILLVVVIVVLSAGATVLVGMLPDRQAVATRLSTHTEPAKPTGPPGRVVLSDEPLYNFGIMAQMTMGEFTWTIKNEGEGDLILTKGGSTCMCTIANLAEGEKATIKPGGSTEVRLTWETKMTAGEFDKAATILVANDPNREDIVFKVQGKVQPAILLMPAENPIDFGTVPNDAPRKKIIGLMSSDRPEMKILGHTNTRKELITVEITPMTDEEKEQMGIKGGQKVEITVHPGKELALFSDEILIQTDHPAQPQVSLSVQGKVVGPISLVPSVVRSHSISGRNGGTVSVAMWVRGQEATDFKVVKPSDGLKVEIKPADLNPVASDKGRKYTMTVTVPPGTPAGPIREPIVMTTDHPLADSVSVPVDLLVIDAR